MEKTDLVTAIASQSDLSLAEAANAVDFVLQAMRADRGPFSVVISSAEDVSADGANLPLLQRLECEGPRGSGTR